MTLNDKKYIATSSPARSDRDLFWKMMMEHQSPLIVKLNQGETDYFPTQKDGKLVFQSLKVQSVYLNIIDPTMTLRVLEIDDGASTHFVTHIDFQCWSDFSVPEKENFHQLLTIVNEVMKLKVTGPITVHCGAGIGRTGTFLGCHASLEIENPDIDQTIKEMRAQRDPNMVETSEQRRFIGEILQDRKK
jgi:protein tyrosine phosphatase